MKKSFISGLFRSFSQTKEICEKFMEPYDEEDMKSMSRTMTKVIWQYSEPLPPETMEFLKGIALDYCKVKNYIYQRYSGIKSLDRLTPVYSILNEMRYCGLREQLDLPVVYYELAIADAVADIKGRWGILKNKIGGLITANNNLSEQDRIYLRTVLKLNNIYAAILNRQEYELPQNAKGLAVDVNRLNNLLCRLTRRYLTVPQANSADSFRISPNGYSYRDGAIRVVCRMPRKRISIPLRDERTFDRQIQVHIRKDFIALAIPVEVRIRAHEDYTNTVYIHLGNKDMFTLSDGTVYGKDLNALVDSETERLARKNRERYKAYIAQEQNREAGNRKKAENIEANNLGREKYDRQKSKERVRTMDFINAEINRMLRTEKPGKIVITRPVTRNKTKFPSKSANRKLSRSFRGCIRERLIYKCKVNAIELVEINSKGTGKTCSSCGAEGTWQGTEFVCRNCGMRMTGALNMAKNIQQKYNG